MNTLPLPLAVAQAAAKMIQDTEIDYIFVEGYLVLRERDGEDEYHLTFLQVSRRVGETPAFKVSK